MITFALVSHVARRLGRRTREGPGQRLRWHATAK